MFSTAAAATERHPPTPTALTPTPADLVSGFVSTLVSAVLSPVANNAPTTPVEPPALWTVLAFARREIERTFVTESPTVNPLAGQITNGLLTGTPTLTGQSIDPVITGNIGATNAGPIGPDFKRPAQRHRGGGPLDG